MDDVFSSKYLHDEFAEDPHDPERTTADDNAPVPESDTDPSVLFAFITRLLAVIDGSTTEHAPEIVAQARALLERNPG